MRGVKLVLLYYGFIRDYKGLCLLGRVSGVVVLLEEGENDEHTFSAFWLRSSVVSVLNCVNAVTASARGLTVHTNFFRVVVSCPQGMRELQSP